MACPRFQGVRAEEYIVRRGPIPSHGGQSDNHFEAGCQADSRHDRCDRDGFPRIDHEGLFHGREEASPGSHGSPNSSRHAPCIAVSLGDDGRRRRLPFGIVPTKDCPALPATRSHRSRDGVETITFTEETIMQTFRAGFALPFEELRDELDRLWTSLTAAPPLHGWGTETRTGVFPALNMRDRDDAILIEAELPGLDVSDIEIAVTADELVLKGTRPSAAAGGEAEASQRAAWLRRERGTGCFERRLHLPVAVDATRVEASLVDGVLTITCPKAPESQPHKVSVRTG